ncbi:unnamed protein product [Arabidopsis halleri]
MIRTQILQRQSRYIFANHSINHCLTRRSYKTVSAVKTHLERWRELGDQVKPSYVRGLVEDFRHTEQFSKALEASEWMCEQRVFNVFPEDYAARLNLVETVLGLEEAEKFFERIPENMRDYSVYENLLRSYTKSEKTLDKAEETFEKMRDLGFLSKPSGYDSMISLYRKLNKRDMVKKLKREMMENNVKIDRPMELNVLSIVSDFKRDCLDPLWNKYKKEGKLMDDEYRIRISYLLKLDDVQGAEKIYQKWQPTGPKLDMSVPGLLISRFRAEGNESKVEEMVNWIRIKRIVMHLATLTLGLINLGLTIVMLAIMVAIITAIVKCNVWLFQLYPLLCVLFCGHIILEYPILFASVFFYIISSY